MNSTVLYYYDTIKTALTGLKNYDGSLKITDVIDETITPSLSIDIEGETFEYTVSESGTHYDTNSAVNFSVFFMFKRSKNNAPELEIRKHGYYWYDLIVSKLQGLTATAFADTVNDREVSIVATLINSCDFLYPSPNDINGIRVQGTLHTNINYQ